VLPEDGVTEAVPVNHGIASALSFEADENQQVDGNVADSGISAADVG
jgi:hypothetical protein